MFSGTEREQTNSTMISTGAPSSYREGTLFFKKTKTPGHSREGSLLSLASEEEQSAPQRRLSIKPDTRKESLIERHRKESMAHQERRDHLLEDRKIRITYRFNTAMDILDTVRKSNGHTVVSPRIEDNVIVPCRNYNQWTKEWCKEFQFDMSSPGSASPLRNT